MGCDEDVVAFLHEGSSDGMAITIIGSLRSLNKMTRVPSRIPISVSHEKEREITEQPTRDRDRASPFHRDLDIRYLKNIKSRLTSSFSCNQELCPKIKERMEYHQLQRHPSRRHGHSRQGLIETDSRSVMTSPAISHHHTSTKCGPDLEDNIQTQTNNYSNIDNNKIKENNYPLNNDNFDDFIPLKRSETREMVAPKRNIYKDYVQKEIKQWLQEVPIYPNLGNNSYDKGNLINELTEKINNISHESNEVGYERKVKFYIDELLKFIRLWYPGAKRDQDIFKNKLNDNLFSRIKDLNIEMLQRNVMDSGYDDDIYKGNRRSRYSLIKAIEMENEINTWLSMMNFRKSSANRMGVSKREVIQNVMKQIDPLLKKPQKTCHYKLKLKNAIFDVLNDLPVGSKSSRNKRIELHKFAEDLANRLLSIQSKFDNVNGRYRNVQIGMYQHESELNKYRNGFENLIQEEVNRCLADTRFSQQNIVKREITKIIMNYVDSPVSIAEFDVKDDIQNVLRGASNIPESLASSITENIIKDIKSALHAYSSEIPANIKPELNRKISVFTTEEKCCPMNFPVTSTPEKARKPIQRLNPEEIEYTDKVGKLIKAWMETLPEQFNSPEDKDFKETIIEDLAGEITDAAKLKQLVSVDENEKWLKYLVYKWLNKLDVYDLEEVAPQVENLLIKLKDIPVPKLTRPQQGNRQAMANIQHMEGELGWKEEFVPRGKDILEDGISIWMNEQPSDMFDADLTARDNKIHELAKDLENKLSKNRPESEIFNDVEQWLGNIVKPEKNNKVCEMADDLKKRVINLPQDVTLVNARDKRVLQKAEYLEAKRNPPQAIKIKKSDDDTVKLDNTMNQFIVKYIEHNYDVSDPMARRAFAHLLKTKLQRLNPPTRKEVYDNFAKSGSNDHLSREKLTKELEYIKDISDWLKNIPIDATFNTVGNRERIDFVIDLAKNILVVEEQREAEPNAMDYNMYMASIIGQFLVQLPIIQEHKNEKNMTFMIDQLLGKVIAHRKIVQHKVNESVDTSGINDDNIGDFIEEFIRLNGSEIADDEVKLEAWSVRLLNEIKKMAQNNADSAALSKAQVYNRLTNVPLPRDESINQFDNEFEYIKEISEWIKNLPLLPLHKNDEEERVRMICELTEKLTERETKKINNPDDTNAEAEFAEYVARWISDLSLDESHEVILAIVIQQLVNRIERVKTRRDQPDLDYIQIIENSKLQSKDLGKKKSSKTLLGGKNKQIKDPVAAIVDKIEKWSTSLPIKADDEKTVKTLRDEVAKKIFQKVGELNIDPRTFNDDLLYQDIISDEVDAVIEKLPQNTELDKNKAKLRDDLVQNIMEAQKVIKENCAGELYKHKLENTIAASIPHPVKSKQVFDPAFEIYKSRLADMFILENFDHGNDAVKTKYERNIKNEIDKYYDSVKNKNAIRLTNDEIYNELYSVLFKVPIPNEASVIKEVEEIKTRCEIDAWFEELPLEEATGITELLERDNILATLAKRINEIEKAESKPADKIHKEIMKWLVKLPLLSGQNNVEQLCKNLENALKSSTEQRKCIVTDPGAKNKKGKSKSKSNDKLKVRKNNSQIPGSNQIEREHVKPKQKAADIVMQMVHDWCNQLPIYAVTPQEEDNAKMIRDSLFTKIIIKISELNLNPETFNDDFLYSDLLDRELDKLLSGIPTCCNFRESKAARKMQLIDGIANVKPLFIEEKAQVKYEQDLNKIVEKVLRKPQELSNEKEILYNNLKEEIIENFLQYNYDKNDDEGRQIYKTNVQDAVLKFLANFAKEKNENPLMIRNQLICELGKIPIPSDDSLKEEVEEIRMKNDITEFFDELAIPDEGDKNRLVVQVKSSLAKKLNNIEMNGHTEENEAKMKQEITKSLKKLNKEVKSDTVAKFVNRLRDDEYIRRAPRRDETDTCIEDCKKSGRCGIQGLQSNNDEGYNSIEDMSNNIGSERNEKPRRKDSRKQKSSDSKVPAVECECPREHSPEPELDQSGTENYQNRPKSPENVDEEERCVCGGLIRRRRPCFVPMRWCMPDDMPVCRVPAPAGFFYY